MKKPVRKTKAERIADAMEPLVGYCDRITTGNVAHNIANLKAAIQHAINGLRAKPLPAHRKRTPNPRTRGGGKK